MVKKVYNINKNSKAALGAKFIILEGKSLGNDIWYFLFKISIKCFQLVSLSLKEFPLLNSFIFTLYTGVTEKGCPWFERYGTGYLDKISAIQNPFARSFDIIFILYDKSNDWIHFLTSLGNIWRFDSLAICTFSSYVIFLASWA